MKLNPDQRQECEQALVSAFRTHADLAQMVRLGLDENIEELAGTGRLRDVISGLVDWAEREGQLIKLVQAALQARPSNGVLRAFASRIGVTSSRKKKFWEKFRSDHPLVVLITVIAGVVTILIPIFQVLGSISPSPTPTPTASISVTPTAIASATATSLPTDTPTRVPVIFPAPTIIQVAIGPDLAGYSKQTSIVRDSRGKLTLLVSSVNGDLGYINSSDGGKSWSDLTVFDNIPPPDSAQVSAAIDYADRIHIVWGPAPNPGDAKYGLLDDGTWVISQTVATGVFARDIAVDSANHPHIVWTTVDVSHTTFNGQEWIGPQQVASGGWHPDIQINANDDLFLFLNDAAFYPTTQTSVYALNNVGGHWNDPVRLSTSPFWSGGAAAAIDSQGDIYVTWIGANSSSGGSDQVFFSRYVGGQWQAPFVLGALRTSAGQTGQESPAVAFDANDILYVFWRGLNSKNRPVIFVRALGTEKSKVAGVTEGWSPTIELDDRSASDVGWPSVADVWPTSSTVGVDVVWRGTVGKNKGIFFSHVTYP